MNSMPASRWSTRWSKRIDRWLMIGETALLGLILTMMMVLAGAQVVLRNLFDAGISWGDPATKALVLWLALVGGFAAARRDRHIRIDLVGHYAPRPLQRLIQAVIAAATAIVCGLLAWHGGRLVLGELEYGEIAFGTVPVWLVQSIIPIGFGLMTLAYLFHALAAITQLVRSR